MEYEDSLCQCGQSRLESFDPENDNAYDVDMLRCFACSAKARRDRALGEDDPFVRDGLYLIPKLMTEEEEVMPDGRQEL
jgi:hypothetical protein